MQIDPLNWNLIIPDLAQSWQVSEDGLTTARVYPTTYWGLWLNFRTKPFDDVRVRRAVNLALDKAALVEAVSESVGTERTGWVLPTDPYFQEYWPKAKSSRVGGHPRLRILPRPSD